MKRLIFFPLLIIGYLSNSQIIFNLDSIPLDETGVVKFDKIFEIKGSKEELTTRAKLWIAESFKGTKDVIRVEDKAEGLISGVASLQYVYTYYMIKNKKVVERGGILKENEGLIDFTMKMYFKDNKARVIITNILLGDITFDKKLIDSTNRLILGTLKEQVSGFENFSKFKSISEEIKSLYGLIEVGLGKKSDKDF